LCLPVLAQSTDGEYLKQPLLLLREPIMLDSFHILVA
jgi:hypothetical protein